MMLEPGSLICLLGQTGAAESAKRILFWLAVLLGAAVAVMVVGAVVRRFYRDEPVPDVTEAFTLSDLRRLHQDGQLSDEEFDRVKAGLIARSRAMLGDSTADSYHEPDSPDIPPDSSPDS